jgi:hypothetical protein
MKIQVTAMSLSKCVEVDSWALSTKLLAESQNSAQSLILKEDWIHS